MLELKATIQGTPDLGLHNYPTYPEDPAFQLIPDHPPLVFSCFCTVDRSAHRLPLISSRFKAPFLICTLPLPSVPGKENPRHIAMAEPLKASSCSLERGVLSSLLGNDSDKSQISLRKLGNVFPPPR